MYLGIPQIYGRNFIVLVLNIKLHVMGRKQGNSVARDLPRTGSKTNTTIFVIYILDIHIDSHCPYLLSGETTFQLTSC